MSTIDQAKKPLTRSQKRDISSISLETSQNKRKISLDSINKSNILDPPTTSNANINDTLTNTAHSNHAQSTSTDLPINQSNQVNNDQALESTSTAVSISDNTPKNIEMTETSKNTSTNTIPIIASKTTDNDKALVKNVAINNNENNEKTPVVTDELKKNSRANNGDSDKMIAETELTNSNKPDHNNEKIPINNDTANTKKAIDQSNIIENTVSSKLKLTSIASSNTAITHHTTIANNKENQKNGNDDNSTTIPTPIIQTSSSSHNIAHKKETMIKPAIAPPEQGKSLLPLRPSTTAAAPTTAHLKRMITNPKFTTINKSSAVRAPFSDRFLISSEGFETYSHHRLANIVKDIVNRNRKRSIRDNKPLALSSRPPKSHSYNPHQQHVRRNSINTGTSSSTATTNKSINQAQPTQLGKNKDGNILDSLLASISSNVRDTPAQSKPPVKHNNKTQQRNHNQHTHQVTDLDIALMSFQ